MRPPALEQGWSRGCPRGAGTGAAHSAVSGAPGPQTLFLQDNSITRLEPGALAPLSTLRRLYLHNNSLRALEAGAFRAQRCLLELALTRNRLRGLRGGAFVGLAQLRVLYLAGNQLARLLDFTFLHLPVSASVQTSAPPSGCGSGTRSHSLVPVSATAGAAPARKQH